MKKRPPMPSTTEKGTKGKNKTKKFGLGPVGLKIKKPK